MPEPDFDELTEAEQIEGHNEPVPEEQETGPIIGYRELTQQEIDLINTIKKIAVNVGSLYDRIEHICQQDEIPEIAVDPHWLRLAGDNLQIGFMCLTRSIAKPDTF